MSRVKDLTIASFYKNYCEFDGRIRSLSFNEIEEVLLAQSKDSFNQMTPSEFFRIQDLYDQVKLCML
jgi:hypothetical protein